MLTTYCQDLTNQSAIEQFHHLSSIFSLNCSEGFSLFPLSNETSVCMPVCGEWEEFSPETVHGFDASLLRPSGWHSYCTPSLLSQLQNHVSYATCAHCYDHLSACIRSLSLHCEISLQIIACRFKFPSILLVYCISIPIILDVTHFIGLAGRRSLFCQSASLFDDPTPFCSFTGMRTIFFMKHYFLLACI